MPSCCINLEVVVISLFWWVRPCWSESVWPRCLRYPDVRADHQGSVWKCKSSSVVVLVILLTHKSFPALADKWTWWPARSFPSLSYVIVRVEALEHHRCCLHLSQLVSGRVCLSVTRRACQLAVSCVLAQGTPLSYFHSLQKRASLLSEPVIVWRLLGFATTRG